MDEDVSSTGQILRYIVEGQHSTGGRITESWIVEQAGVTHAQAREILHRLDKLGAVTLAPRRGATLIRPEEADTGDMQPIWRALLQLASERAIATRKTADQPVPTISQGGRWDRYASLSAILAHICNPGDNARLARLLQHLTLKFVVAQGGTDPIDLDALHAFAAALHAKEIDKTALYASFRTSAERMAGHRDGTQNADLSLGSIHAEGVSAAAARDYVRRVSECAGTRSNARAQSTTGQIADAILQRIQFGELRPGDQIREQPLAEEFGVSRAPVRDALRTLDRRGLVTIEPKRGAFVNRFTAPAVTDLFEVRAAISGVQMAEAARAPNRPGWVDAELMNGAETLAMIARDPNSPVSNYIVTRRALAIVTLAAGGNVLIGKVASGLEAEVSLLWTTVLSKRRQENSAATWRMIVDAIINRDIALAAESGAAIVRQASIEAVSAAGQLETADQGK